LGVNITAGVSAISVQEDIEAAITRADAALYQGKNSGRNRWLWLAKPANANGPIKNSS
jgi:PleD family two-component response regulator